MVDMYLLQNLALICLTVPRKWVLRTDGWTDGRTTTTDDRPRRDGNFEALAKSS